MAATQCHGLRRSTSTAAKWPAATSLSGSGRKRAASNGIRSQSIAGLQPRNRRQQRLRVRMRRRREERLGRRHFDEPAAIHHGHAIADLAHQPQIVRDEEIGQAEALLQIEQQIDDLRLHRHVERRHRLVAHDERRLERERARHADALALAAAEFVRILARRRPDRGRPARTAAARAPAARRACRSGG